METGAVNNQGTGDIIEENDRFFAASCRTGMR